MTTIEARNKLIALGKEENFTYLTMAKFSKSKYCALSDDGHLLKKGDDLKLDFFLFLQRFYFNETCKVKSDEKLQIISKELLELRNECNPYLYDCSLMLMHTLLNNKLNIIHSDLFLCECAEFGKRDIGDNWAGSVFGRFILDGEPDTDKLLNTLVKNKQSLLEMCRLYNDLCYTNFEQYYSNNFQNGLEKIINKYA